MLLQNRIDSINSQVKVYLDEIAKLQAKVTQLQAHAQEVQGAEQAAESALAQIDTAISMLSAICPDEISVFKAAIDAKFSAPLPQLQEGADNEGVIDLDTTPPDPDADVIEITAVVVNDSIIEESNSKAVDNGNDPNPQKSESNLVDPEVVEDNPITSDSNDDGKDLTSDDNGNSNGNGHSLLSYEDLRIVDRPTLIKLANSHNLPNYKSKKKDELASLLDGMITPNELASAQNGKH